MAGAHTKVEDTPGNFTVPQVSSAHIYGDIIVVVSVLDDPGDSAATPLVDVLVSIIHAIDGGAQLDVYVSVVLEGQSRVVWHHPSIVHPPIVDEYAVRAHSIRFGRAVTNVE